MTANDILLSTEMLVDVHDATIGHEDNDDATDILHCLLNALDAAEILLPHNLLAAILSVLSVDVDIMVSVSLVVLMKWN